MVATVPQVLRLRQQATTALTALKKEIAKQEQELAVLKAEATRWKSLLGGQSKGANASAAPSQVRKATRRLDWSAILAGLPRTFTAREVATKTGKPIEQIYTHLSQWMKDKKVKKGKDGYQKVSAEFEKLSGARLQK